MNMEDLLAAALRFFRPVTFVVWGFILLLVSSLWSASANVDPSSSFFGRHVFVFTLVSWIAGLVLLVRLALRRRRNERTMFD